MNGVRVSARQVSHWLEDAPHPGPRYQAIALGLRQLIANGRISHGQRLPSERELTAHLGVSRVTISRAYAELVAAGFAVAKHGSGTVATVPGSGVVGLSEPLPQLIPPPAPSAANVIDLVPAAPPAAAGVADAFAEVMAALPHHLSGSGYHPYGLAELREVVAQRYCDQGVPTVPDQIVVTTGAMSAISLAVRVLSAPGDRVVLEDPCYPNSLTCVRQHRAVPVGCPVGDVSAFAGVCGLPGVKVALLNPDFHNPTGQSLPLLARQRVADVLDRQQMWGIVDDSMIDLGLADPPGQVASMAGLSDRLVSVGSVSKSLWSGLRVGWLRCPKPLLTAVYRAKLASELGAAVVEQLVVAHLLRSQDEVFAERRNSIRRSRDAAFAQLVQLLPQWRVQLPQGGLTLWCQLPQPWADELVHQAAQVGVVVAPGQMFSVSGQGWQDRLRIAYAASESDLAEGISRLAAAWQQVSAERVE